MIVSYGKSDGVDGVLTEPSIPGARFSRALYLIGWIMLIGIRRDGL